MKNPRTLAQLQADYRVSNVYQDEDGWWVNLKPQFISDDTETGTIHEDTIQNCCSSLSSVRLRGSSEPDNISINDFPEILAEMLQGKYKPC